MKVGGRSAGLAVRAWPTRKYSWWDKKTKRTVYGFKIKHPTFGWFPCCDDDGVVRFPTKQERDTYLKEWRQ